MTVGFVTNPNHAAHAVDEHPEGPERLEAVLQLIEESGLINRLTTIAPRDASDGELTAVHREAYVEALRRACAQGGGWADPDTYIAPGSCDAAWLAAGACVAATEAVLAGDVRSAFCAVRPPGHHARPAQAMGFCLLNNVAVAARYARQHGIDRVAIVDIDVHHGNGTQDAFYEDPSVLYVSTHQYPFYPGTGRASETGAGEAAGTNVNIPLPGGCGDEQYRAAFEQLVEPAMRRFRPQLLLVSCGFDAHYADTIAAMALSVDGYGELAARLQALTDELCDGRSVFVLEGGYDLDAVAWCARRVIEVLLGDPPTPDPLGPSPYASANIDALLAELGKIHGLL
jgi:acetoin utilization deacetylase AcuC-like enzyme